MASSNGQPEGASKDAAFAQALRAALAVDRARISSSGEGAAAATSSSAAGPADVGQVTARPPRLGLGAKPKQEAKTAVLAHKVVGKLRRSAKRKREREADQASDGTDDDDDDDGGVGVKGAPHIRGPALTPLDSILAEKSKKKKKKGSKKNKQQNLEESSTGNTHGDVLGNTDVLEKEHAPAETTEPGASHEDDGSAWESFWVEDRVGDPVQSANEKNAGTSAAPTTSRKPKGLSGASGSTRSAVRDTPQPKRRKKIRSKQKNLRKDNRPEHLKPKGPPPRPGGPKPFFRKNRGGRGGRGGAGRGGGSGGRGEKSAATAAAIQTTS